MAEKEANKKQTKEQTQMRATNMENDYKQIREETVEHDLRRKVTFRSDASHPNPPSENRVGKPKTHWTLTNMKRVWELLRIDNRSLDTRGMDLDYKNQKHLHLIMEAAQLKESS